MCMHNSTGKVIGCVYNESSVPEQRRDSRSWQEASAWSPRWLKIQTNRQHVLLSQYVHFTNTKEITVKKQPNAYLFTYKFTL